MKAAENDGDGEILEIRERLEAMLTDAASPAGDAGRDPVFALLAGSTELHLGSERRGEARLDLFLSSPLIGWLADMKTSFEYRPLNISTRGLKMELDLSSGQRVEDGVQMDLCLPFRSENEVLNHCEIRWATPQPGGYLCGARLCRRNQNGYRLRFDFSSGRSVVSLGNGEPRRKLGELFLWVLEDAIFIKRALILYLGHLAPLLARLSKMSRDDLSAFKRQSLDLVESRIRGNIEILEELKGVVGKLAPGEAATRFLDRFRGAISPEINEFSLRRLVSTPEGAAYLQSIRLSDRKLAMHYNAMVLLLEEHASASSA